MSEHAGSTAETRQPGRGGPPAPAKASVVSQAIARAIVADQLLQIEYPERALYWLDQYISRR